jgi:hypothetical protein
MPVRMPPTEALFPMIREVDGTWMPEIRRLAAMEATRQAHIGRASVSGIEKFSLPEADASN